MKNKVIVIEGEDADLIILSLLLLEENKIYIKRQEHDTAISMYIDIEKLKEKLCMKVDDYVVKSFFLGNDFLPNHPMFNLRENGMELILKDGRSVTKNGKIEWKSLYLWLKTLKQYERERMCIQLKKSNKVKEMELIPQMYRQVETYINPSISGWERRYRNEQKSDSDNYIRGISWIYNYYLGNEIDESWYYEGSSPLIIDMLESIRRYKEPKSNLKSNLKSNPYTKEYQLSYVLDTSPLKYDWTYKKYLWESRCVGEPTVPPTTPSLVEEP